jgi:hypothetical protein
MIQLWLRESLLAELSGAAGPLPKKLFLPVLYLPDSLVPQN